MGEEMKGNHSSTWRTYALMAVALIATRAFADKKEKPVDAVSPACDKMSGQVVVKHYGQSWFAALQTYTLELDFTPGEKSFGLASNWDINFETKLDEPAETMTTRFTSTSGRFLNGWSPRVHLGPTNPEDTMHVIANTALYLTIAKSRLKSGQRNEAEQIKAIDCAQERLKAYAALIRRKYIQFRNLGIPDGAVGGQDAHH
jgi:hypothetical protein